MAQSLAHASAMFERTGSRAPRAYWNPYLVGVLLGLVLLATYAITGRGLGATAGFAAVAAWLAGLVRARRTSSPTRCMRKLLERRRTARVTGPCSC